jgi:hypothetical protein
MTKTFAARTTPLALAALLTMAMLASTNALASHQYRVSVASHERTTEVAAAVQHVTIVGHRHARA